MNEAAPSFEETYQRLEALVAKLELGGLSLDESIELYEEATQLAAACHRLLDRAELRVRQLQERTAEAAAPYAPEDEEAPSLFDRLEEGRGLLVPCAHCGELIPSHSASCIYCGKPHSGEQTLP